MNLSDYVSKKIKVDLINGYFYEGFVLLADDNSLTLIDKNNKKVTIREGMISFIREVGEDGK